MAFGWDPSKCRVNTRFIRILGCNAFVYLSFSTGWGWNAPTASTPAPGKMFLLWWLRLCIPPPSFCWTFIPFPLSSLPVCILSSLLFPPACLSPFVSFRFGVSGKTFEMGFSSAHRWSCRLSRTGYTWRERYDTYTWSQCGPKQGHRDSSSPSGCWESYSTRCRQG